MKILCEASKIIYVINIHINDVLGLHLTLINENWLK
jgi:hypothetical protein